MICDLPWNCSRWTYLQWWRRVPLAMRKDFTGPGLRGLAQGSIDVHLEMPRHTSGLHRHTSGLHLHTKARLTKDLLTDRYEPCSIHNPLAIPFFGELGRILSPSPRPLSFLSGSDYALQWCRVGYFLYFFYREHGSFHEIWWFGDLIFLSV